MPRPTPQPPRDYAPGYDPYRTDPNFTPLSEQELIQPHDALGDDGKDRKKRKEKKRPRRTADARPKRPGGELTPESPEFSHGASMLKTAFDFLIPSRDADPETIRRWRLAMGLSWFVFVFHLATSWGFMGWAGLHGFASASDVREMRAEQLYGQLETAVKAHCQAPTSDSKAHYFERISKLTAKYNEASREPYQRPTCWDLGVKEVFVGGP